MADSNPPSPTKLLETTPENNQRNHFLKPKSTLRTKRKHSSLLEGLSQTNIVTIEDEGDNNDVTSSKTVSSTPFLSQSRRTTRQSMHGRADALYDQKYHPMDEVTRPKSAFKHRKRSIHTTSENEVDNITPRFHEGIHHSKRTSGRKRPCYNTETHTQDQLLALADIRRLNNRRHPQKKVKIENDRESETVQVNVRARSDSDVCDLSREEVFMHSALGVHDRNDFGTKARYRDELVVPNTTSGEDDSVSPVIDGFKIPVPFDCSHPIQGEFDKESSTQCIEPFRLSSPIGWSEIAAIPPDTSHSIHDQKNPGCDYSDGTGWIDIAKRAVEELQKISHNPEESVPLDYDIFVQGNERTPVARRLPRISSFTLSSEYSCGQLQSPLMTEARDGRKVARFQVYMDSWQSTPNEDHFISTFEQSPDEATGNMPRQILTEEDENLKNSLSHQHSSRR